VFYAADGQRVPEDLHLADARKLVEAALQRAPEHASYGAVDLDCPLELAGSAVGMQAAQVAQASRGVIHG